MKYYLLELELGKILYKVSDEEIEEDMFRCWGFLTKEPERGWSEGKWGRHLFEDNTFTEVSEKEAAMLTMEP